MPALAAVFIRVTLSIGALLAGLASSGWRPPGGSPRLPPLTPAWFPVFAAVGVAAGYLTLWRDERVVADSSLRLRLAGELGLFISVWGWVAVRLLRSDQPPYVAAGVLLAGLLASWGFGTWRVARELDLPSGPASGPAWKACWGIWWSLLFVNALLLTDWVLRDVGLIG